MERKELDKYKIISTDQARDNAFLLYELWMNKVERHRIGKKDFGKRSSDSIFIELKKVRIVTVQMIAEETGRKYEPEIFSIARKNVGQSIDKQFINIDIDYQAKYEPFDKNNPVIDQTSLYDVRPYMTSGLFNSLKRCNCETIKDALSYSDEELFKFRVFGKKRIEELNAFYKMYGLR